MVLYLTLTVYGLFVHNEDSNIKQHILMYPNVDMATTILGDLDAGREPVLLKEFGRALVEYGIKEIIVDDTNVARVMASIDGLTVVTERTAPAIRRFRGDIERLLVDKQLIRSIEKALAFRRDVALEIARAKVRAASRFPDLQIKHAIDTISEIDKSINALFMRLRVWFSSSNPQLSEMLEDQELFLKFMQLFSHKQDATMKDIIDLGAPETVAEHVIQRYNDALTILKEDEMNALRYLTLSIQNQVDTRKRLESYVSKLMQETAPNITALVGPLVGARLIGMAGSLRDLAKKPASTIQVLGAEKALFRSLRTGTAPPKHGIIFQVPVLHSAPYWQRGKIARALAGKLAIAAKVDAYSGRDIGAVLKEAFDKRVAEIKQQHPEPPMTKPQARVTKIRGEIQHLNKTERKKPRKKRRHKK